METFDRNDFSLMIQPEDEAIQRRCIATVLQGLDEFEQAKGQDDHNRPLILAVVNHEGAVVAGLLAKLLRGWLRIDMLWVAENLRGMGYGAKLMRRAEVIATAEGCRGIHLETCSFQAPDFYKLAELIAAFERAFPSRILGYFLEGSYADQSALGTSDCHRLYRQYVNDESASFLTELYERCRNGWRYLIPTGKQERTALRAICQRALNFENHFLQVYRQFLRAELTADDEARRARALWVQEKLPFQDEA